MATEVRLYTINRGMMDSWLTAFKEKIMPTSAQYGIRIHAAWVNRPQNEFIWLRSYDSAEQLEAYYKSPERAAYSEHVGSPTLRRPKRRRARPHGPNVGIRYKVGYRNFSLSSTG